MEQGRRELASGEAERASLTLREALALWRGPALADLAFEPFAQTEIARLEELRLTALESPDRSGPRARTPGLARRRARDPRFRTSLPRGPARPADARPLPKRSSGRGARDVQARSAGVQRGARDRARPPSAGAGGSDPSPRFVARSAWPGGAAGPRRGVDRDGPAAAATPDARDSRARRRARPRGRGRPACSGCGRSRLFGPLIRARGARGRLRRSHRSWNRHDRRRDSRRRETGGARRRGRVGLGRQSRRQHPVADRSEIPRRRAHDRTRRGAHRRRGGCGKRLGPQRLGPAASRPRHQ